MDKKKIIQIVIIVAAFAGSGLVLYNGMFKKPSLPASSLLPGLGTPSGAAPGSSGTVSPILPYGSKLDFSGVLNKRGMEFGAISYPVLDPASEVGVQPQDLLKAPTPASPAP